LDPDGGGTVPGATQTEIDIRPAAGADSLRLSVGDISIALESVDPSLRLQVQGASELFLQDGAAADMTVRAGWRELRDVETKDQVFDSGSVWQLHRDDTGHLFRFRSPVYGTIPYKEARFNADFSCGELSLHEGYFDRNKPVYPLEYPLDELLIVNLLAQGRGVEVHACGVEDTDGRGYLFIGHSGAGKTTMARQWPTEGVKILSDDRIILRSAAGRIWMYGTPWHGEAELACATRTELSEILFLGRGDHDEVVPLPQARAVARLMACSFLPFYDAAGLAYTLSLFQEITDSVPCGEIRFVPKPSVIEFVRRRPRG
jgi:hypothetical protein